MAVTAVQEDYRRSGSRNYLWQRQYQRTFKVLTNSQYDGTDTVLQSLPVQVGFYYQVRDALGNPVEHDFGSFVNTLSARCVSDDGLQWEATADYAPYNPSFFPQNPLNWPIKVSHGTVKYERAIEADITGKAILNSAGDYFDPPVVVDDSRPILRIQRNEPSYDPSIADKYKDSINKDIFFGQQPGTWKIADITGDLEFNVDSGTPDGFYYVVTYEFEFRSEGWKKIILDQGLKVLSGGVQTPATLNGKDIQDPILLDGKGAALASGDDPVFLVFDVYEEIEFAPLDLDPNGAPGQG